MSEIEFTRKITISMKFTKSPGSRMFISYVLMPPNHSIDEIVIRDVRWISKPLDEKFYSLWTNISDDFIAGWQKFKPLPKIIKRTPPNDVMEFRLYFLEIESEPFKNDINGEFYIDLEFITYKKN